LIDSVFLLGQEAQDATARFLVWQLDAIGHVNDRPFFALALAALVQSLNPDLSIIMEQALANWVAGEESSERTYLSRLDDSYRDSRWMFGLSFNDMRNERWESLIRSLLAASADTPLGRLLAEHYKV
jgi:hypothetical protein